MHTSDTTHPSPANRLKDATSPYLLQHAHNPVDWYPWGDEAIQKAKAENKPIFLSIGYSACHWCHVMEREVFEKQDIANIMNEHFINIKVDREERPDLDDLYMLATQVSTGSGGWPMSVWLTPDLEPFYAGTYFPPTDSHGRPGFPRLDLAIADAWKTRPDELRAQARKVIEAVTHYANESSRSGGGDAKNIQLHDWLTTATEQFADRFDPEFGGLGSAPKFPPSQALPLWLELLKAQRTQSQSADPSAPSSTIPQNTTTLLRTMLTTTLDHMMRGGIYDQIGGAFARYSTDQHWLVPHFEKMLYDNAQLAPTYALAALHLGRPDYARIASRTLDFWLREMTSPQGAFYSTLDADSEGREGKFYVWTLPEIHAAIPNADDANLLIKHFGITSEGNWPEGGEGANVLHIARPVADLAPDYNITPEVLQKRIDAICLRLREARARRIPPGLDDKILTSWNGLMISALAITGRLQREPRYLEAAHRAMGFLLMHHMERGRKLLRTSRNGHAHIDAYLEDHAYLLNAMCDIVDSTSPTSLPGTMARKRALELADTMIRDFEDHDHGGFFFTTLSHDQLFVRMKNATDGATPSANGVAIRALLRLAQSSGIDKYRDTALRAVAAFAPTIQKQPSMFATILQALLEDARFLAQTPHLGIPTPVVEILDPLPVPPGAPDPIPLGLELTPDLPDPLPALAPGQSHLTLAPLSLPPVKPGASFDIPLTLTIADGYHIQPHTPRDREAFATVARIRTDLPLISQEWHYPVPHAVPNSPNTLWAGTITLLGHCTVAQSAPAPAKHSLRVTVLAQPCSATSCLPPEKVALEIPIEVIA